MTCADKDIIDNIRQKNVFTGHIVGDTVKILSVNDRHSGNWTNTLVRGLTGVIKEIIYCSNQVIDQTYTKVVIELDIKSKTILTEKCNCLLHLKGWNHNRVMVANPVFEVIEYKGKCDDNE